MDGPVSEDTKVYRFWGAKVMLPVALVTLVVVLVVEAPRVAALGRALLPIGVMLGFLFLAFAVMVGGTFGAIGGGIAKGTAVAAGAMGRAAVSGARGMTRVRGGSVTEQSLPVRRFRVKSPTGAVQACVLVGELDGADVRQGDVLTVHGRVTGDGHRLVKRLEILGGVNGPVTTTVTPRRPVTFRVAQALDVAAKIWSLLLLLGLVATLVVAAAT